jgi:hypothetical protein
VYHSKVVVICWAAVFMAAALTAAFKRHWSGLGMILAGAGLTAAGIAISAWLDHPVGALILSVALLAAALTTLLGIAKVFRRSSG